MAQSFNPFDKTHSDKEVQESADYSTTQPVRKKRAKPKPARRVPSEKSPSSKSPPPQKLGRQKANRTKTGPSVASKAFWYFAYSQLVLVLIGLMAFTTLHIRLGYSPLAIQSLVPLLERSINQQLNGLQVRLSNVVLKRSAMAINVRIQNLEILLPSGESVVKAPEAALTMNGLGLLKGEFSPSSIELIEPRIDVFYARNRGFSLFQIEKRNNDQPKNNNQPEQVSASSIFGGAFSDDELTQLAERSGLAIEKHSEQLGKELSRIFRLVRASRKESAALKHVSAKRGEVVVHSNSKGESTKHWHFPALSLKFEHVGDASEMKGELKVAISKEQQPKIDFLVTETNDAQKFNLNFESFEPSELMQKIGGEGLLRQIDLPISANMNIEVGRDERIRDASAIVKLEPGNILVPGSNVAALKIKASTVRLKYENKQREKFRILPSVIRWDQNEAVLKGTLTPLIPVSGWATGTYNVMVENIMLGAKRPGKPPLYAGQWISQGTYDALSHHIHVSDFVYQADKTEVYLSGDIFRTDQIPDIELNGEFRSVSLGMIRYFWSPEMGEATSYILNEQVKRGSLKSGRIQINMKQEDFAEFDKTGLFPDKSFLVNTDVKNLLFAYLPNAPLINIPNARLNLSGRAMDLNAPHAISDLGSGRRVSFKQTRFEIDDYLDPKAQGKLNFEIETTSGSVVELLQTEAFSILNPQQVSPHNFGGLTKGKMSLKIPLYSKNAVNEIAYEGKVRLSKLKSKKAFGDMDVTDGKIDLRISNKAIDTTGRIFIEKIPADVNWRYLPNKKIDQQPEIRVNSFLSVRDRKRLGIKLSPIVDGGFPFSVVIKNQKSPALPKVKITATLDGTEMRIKALNWQKAKGLPANLQMAFVRKPGKKGFGLNNLVFRSNDLVATGQIGLGKGKRLSTFKFDQIALGSHTSLSVSGRVRRNDNVLQLNVKGQMADARKWINKHILAIESGDASNKKSPYHGIDLRASIQNVYGYHQSSLKGALIDLKIRKGKLVSHIAKGWFGNGDPISSNLIIGDNNRRFMVIQSRNAGELFKWSGIYNKVKQGQSTIKIALDPKPGEVDHEGVLLMSKFVLVGEEVVKEVLDSAQTNPTSQGNKPKVITTELEFDMLKVPFKRRSGSFSLLESYVNGPLIGATLRGRVDLANKNLDLAGTYVPLYGINSTLGAVPILGDILVGRKGEGIFGITFGIRGPTSNPEVVVNPVSLITPGIFRQIMEFNTSEDLARIKAKKPETDEMVQ